MDCNEIKYSVIIPIYNRRDEAKDLLESLDNQTVRNFEAIFVEDGSSVPCKDIVESYPFAKYYFKENEGRSIARNYGIERSSGEWLLFFDSDCVIPEDYFEKLEQCISENPEASCFGGPDAAHDSFTDTQKAINYSMTSFLTTGGIRGGKISLEKFVPRTFNMGYKRDVYNKVGGFREMFSEDIEMSTRIRNAGFSISLFPDLYVYHKRRVDFKKFMRQVYVFGMSRITLKLLYPGSLKIVHSFPALFLIGVIGMIILAIFSSPYWLIPLVAYLLAIFITAVVKTRSIKISTLAVPASIIQLAGYGAGFLKAYFVKIVLGKGRDIQEEIILRKGK